MEFTEFIKQVDTAAANGSKKELAKFIHDIARVLPREQREGFLEKLEELLQISGEAKEPALNTAGEESLPDRLRQVEKQLQEIIEGTLSISGTLSEQYDDWYDEGEEFLFEDPENVIPIIQDAALLVHQCVDQGLYQDCRRMAEELVLLEITVDGEYLDYADSPITIKNLMEYGVDVIDYRQLVIDALIAAYWTTPMEERAGAIWSLLREAGYRDLTLEEVIQAGREELEDLPEFLEYWIDYLGTRTEYLTETLLTEALTLQNDPQKLLEAARKYYHCHPSLYEWLLKQNLDGGNDEEQFQIGQEALRSIPSHYIIRAKVALLTAVYALRQNKQEDAELCWMEAFRSDTRPVNYLRVAVETADFSKYKETAKRIYQHIFERSNLQKGTPSMLGTWSENRIDSKTYFVLEFFGGEFQNVLDKGMNVKEALGWSSTFMKEGMALFLLYLNKGERLSLGGKAMCGIVRHNFSFTANEYSQGLPAPKTADDDSLLWDCLRKWKESVGMSEAVEQAVMEKLDQWVLIRVKGILGENRRKYYGECAAFIAALGEARESRGQKNGKAALIESYRSAYPRHSAFRKELSTFGMK